MTPRLAYCFDDDGVESACELMGDESVRHLIVVDRQENLVGIVGLLDVTLRAGEPGIEGDTLQAVCERREVTRRQHPDCLETLRSIAGRNLERGERVSTN